jgi:hypothetical protein
VTLDGPYDTHDYPYLTIEGYRDPSVHKEGDPERKKWRDWYLKTFPPEVREQITLLLCADFPHAG